MSQAGRDALTRELRQLRDFARGGVVRGVATFTCEDTKCPVGQLRVAFAEELGSTKPMQAPCRCVRCGGELGYVGMQRS